MDAPRTPSPVPAPYITCERCGHPYPGRAAVHGQKVCPTCALLVAIDEAVISDRLNDPDIITAALELARSTIGDSDIVTDLTAAIANLTDEEADDDR